MPVEVGRRETPHPCTDQQAVLWADHQLLGYGDCLLFTLVKGCVVPDGPTLRNGEGPGDPGLEVVQDFRGVDQFQMARGKPVTQHLEATEAAGWGWGKGVAGRAHHMTYLFLLLRARTLGKGLKT